MDIILKEITKKYREQDVLNGVNLNVRKGTFHCLVGNSGNGKTTILKIISGLIKPDKGSCYFNGSDVTMEKAQNRGIGYVMQSPLLFPHLSVAKNISFGLEVKGYSKEKQAQRISELLTLFKIEDISRKMPSMISGGQSQRVSIARALAGNTKVLLMDEPFSSLDPKLREEMGSMIKQIQKQIGITILFVTHDINEALRLSDDISVLQDGKIVQSGPKFDIYERPVNKQVADFFGTSNWIGGVVENEKFICDVGIFDAEGVENGIASGFIRPHAVKITSDNTGFTGKIIKIDSSGRETRIEVLLNKTVLYSEMLGKPANAEGENVYVKFTQNFWIK